MTGSTHQITWGLGSDTRKAASRRSMLSAGSTTNTTFADRSGWDLSLRGAVAMGQPYTATVGLYEAGANTWYPQLSDRNDARLPWFHQLDLRVAKTWLAHHSSWVLALEIFNVSNARNALRSRLGCDDRNLTRAEREGCIDRFADGARDAPFLGLGIEGEKAKGLAAAAAQRGQAARWNPSLARSTAPSSSSRRAAAGASPTLAAPPAPGRPSSRRTAQWPSWQR